MAQLEDGYTFAVADVDVSEKQNEQTTCRVKAEDEKRLDDDEKCQIFDAVYDEIGDVVLPNTLWNSLRDPDRKFIIFIKVDQTNISLNQMAVKVTDAFNLDVYVDGVHHTNETLHELSVDTLTKLLNELNEKSERV